MSYRGGKGRDVLSGGPGADVFRWLSVADTSPVAGRADVVLDFSHNSLDRLDLAPIDANTLIGGNQAFAFVGQGTFTAAGQIRYEIVGSEVRIFLNTDLDPDAEGVIRLAHVQSMSGGDFLL